MFLYTNQFLLIFSFLSIPIELWESTAAIYRQSAGYVFAWELCFFFSWKPKKSKAVLSKRQVNRHLSKYRKRSGSTKRKKSTAGRGFLGKFVRKSDKPASETDTSSTQSGEILLADLDANNEVSSTLHASTNCFCGSLRNNRLIR